MGQTQDFEYPVEPPSATCVAHRLARASHKQGSVTQQPKEVSNAARPAHRSLRRNACKRLCLGSCQAIGQRVPGGQGSGRGHDRRAREESGARRRLADRSSRRVETRKVRGLFRLRRHRWLPRSWLPLGLCQWQVRAGQVARLHRARSACGGGEQLRAREASVESQQVGPSQQPEWTVMFSSWSKCRSS
jgi:hypothetical protein